MKTFSTSAAVLKAALLAVAKKPLRKHLQRVHFWSDHIDASNGHVIFSVYTHRADHVPDPFAIDGADIASVLPTRQATNALVNFAPIDGTTSSILVSCDGVQRECEVHETGRLDVSIKLAAEPAVQPENAPLPVSLEYLALAHQIAKKLSCPQPQIRLRDSVFDVCYSDVRDSHLYIARFAHKTDN